MARRIEVEIVGDSSSLERAFARSSRSAQKFSRNTSQTFRGTARGFSALQGAVGALGVGLGVGAVIQGVKGLVNAASDLNEEINKSSVVFGHSASSIQAWSKTTDRALGLSQQQSLAAAGAFGAMFKTMGASDSSAASMSKRMVVLASDMASFNNQDPGDMLDRLRSGLAGEAEPLRRFGILLSEARVKQEAYRSGLAKAGTELTEQQKVQARYQLILRDTTRQQGDFARTSSGLANQQRILRAQVDNLASALGKALLPYVTETVTQFNEWLARPENKKKVIDGFTKSVEGLADAFESAADAIKTFVSAVDAIRDVRNKVRGIVKPLDDLLGLAHPQAVVKGFAGLIGVEMRKAGKEATTEFNTGLAMGLRGAGRDPFDKPWEQASAAAKKGRKKIEKQKPITTEMRNQWFDARIARQLDRVQDLSLRKQVARLKEIARTIRSRLSVTKDKTRQLTLEDQLLSIARQQRQVQSEITANIQAGNQALRDRADAIKSAIIEKLQARQTNILNTRALADAKEQLRIAKQIGGPAGIKEAGRAVADVRMDILRARAEQRPVTLTAGGRLAVAGVTININGVTDPAAVANRVVAILRRRDRRTTTSQRGAAAGSHTGPK